MWNHSDKKSGVSEERMRGYVTTRGLFFKNLSHEHL